MGFEKISLLRIATDRRAPAWEAGVLNYEHLLYEQKVNGSIAFPAPRQHLTWTGLWRHRRGRGGTTWHERLGRSHAVPTDRERRICGLQQDLECPAGLPL